MINYLIYTQEKFICYGFQFQEISVEMLYHDTCIHLKQLKSIDVNRFFAYACIHTYHKMV